jgi:hypothetical protein
MPRISCHSAWDTSKQRTENLSAFDRIEIIILQVQIIVLATNHHAIITCSALHCVTDADFSTQLNKVPLSVREKNLRTTGSH